jgi:sterol desaturase/sphingolipid hydroxylase (fatty acid hydroxylase superfamily)
MEYIQVFIDSFWGTVLWTGRLITFSEPWYVNYFWGLVLISFLVWGLEMAFPWRKEQSVFRKDFWLDGFYMFFNFFVFSVFIAGFYAVTEKAMGSIGLQMDSLALIDLKSLPLAVQLILFFIVLDFVQWFTHILLHRYEFLWRFHKVHHSVEEMGFAAHLRYHWMENIFYKPLKTLAVMVLGGFEPSMAFAVHFFAILIGHLNHANIKITWGPLRYLLNNPVMHLYHHAKHLPSQYPRGVNFGISLSIWDYIFGTHYIPEEGGKIELGFEEVEQFPKTFWGQVFYGFKK